MWLIRNRSPNACFSIPYRDPEGVNGRELYAGGIPRGLTTWQIQENKLSVALYQSPDAHYIIGGNFSGEAFSGRGNQGISVIYPGQPEPPETYFLAERIGPPDVVACLSD
jgi:hypothetical protein